MHSTTLTEPVRELYREPGWPRIDGKALAALITREADRQLAKILAPKRAWEIRCPDCHMILGRQAGSCFC